MRVGTIEMCFRNASDETPVDVVVVVTQSAMREAPWRPSQRDVSNVFWRAELGFNLYKRVLYRLSSNSCAERNLAAGGFSRVGRCSDRYPLLLDFSDEPHVKKLGERDNLPTLHVWDGHIRAIVLLGHSSNRTKHLHSVALGNGTSTR